MNTTLARSLGWIAFGAAVSLAACNSNNSSTNPSTYPNCTAPGSFQAIYPINGSTNVPDSTQVVYVASSVALGSQYQNAVLPPGGYLQSGNQFSQVPLSQVPTPRATPGFANPIYYQTAVGTLSSASTWTFYLNNTNSNCQPVQYLQFTTQ